MRWTFDIETLPASPGLGLDVNVRALAAAFSCRTQLQICFKLGSWCLDFSLSTRFHTVISVSGPSYLQLPLVTLSESSMRLLDQTNSINSINYLCMLRLDPLSPVYPSHSSGFPRLFEQCPTALLPSFCRQPPRRSAAMVVYVLPTPLVVLTVLSFIFTTITFVLSLQNYGILSTWISAGSAIATLVYHFVIVFVSFRALHKRIAAPKFYSTPRILWIYVLLAMWVTVFGLIVQTTIGGPGSLGLSEINAPYNTTIQRAECVIIGMQVLVMLSLAGVSTVAKRRLKAEKAEKEAKGIEDSLYDGVSPFFNGAACGF